MGNVNESYHSLAKWSRVCLKLAGLLTGSISIHPVISSEEVSFWSLSWKTLKNRRYFYSRWGWCQAWAWGWQFSHCGLHSSYHLGQQSGSSRWGAWGSAGPTGPGGPGGGSGGGGGDGASPPPGPPPPPLGGTGAAISKTQCNNKLTLTLLVD